MISQETIQEMTQRLIKAYDPLEIYLFGPYAWGNPDEDTNLSVLIIVDSSDEKVYKRGDRAFNALLSLKVPANVTVFTKQEFDTFTKDSTSLSYEVKNRGKILYARG